MREYHYGCRWSWPTECHSVSEQRLFRFLPYGRSWRTPLYGSHRHECTCLLYLRCKCSSFQCAISAPCQPASAIKILIADAHSQRGNRGGGAERRIHRFPDTPKRRNRRRSFYIDCTRFMAICVMYSFYNGLHKCGGACMILSMITLIAKSGAKNCMSFSSI